MEVPLYLKKFLLGTTSVTVFDMHEVVIQTFQELFAFQIPTSTMFFMSGVCSIVRQKIRHPLGEFKRTVLIIIRQWRNPIFNVCHIVSIRRLATIRVKL